MNRKNTILLAVFVNAALLVILFISALHTQDEPSTSDLGAAPSYAPPKIEAPLFSDEADLAMREHAPVEMALPEPSASQETPVVHNLPPLAETKPEPVAVLEAPKIPTVAQKPPATQEKEDANFLQVIVKKGDTLEKIAKEYKTTVDEIIKFNRLPSSFLRIGQVLKIPTNPMAAVKMQTAANPSLKEMGPEYYTVKMGDNPWTIATKHHLKVDELLKLNALNEEKARKLKPGDRLRIR